ncbi:MAG: methionine adenosyltransferase [Clostridia bacterium]|nr:methionine adenosyltransferase [Clostridia bacterium]
MRRLFTSESVTEGHPDKVCDYISDSILDSIYEKDNGARVAVETCAKDNEVIVLGEVTTSANIDYESVARQAIREIGYTKEEYGFDAESCKIQILLDKQSPDIALGVDDSLETKNGENLGHGAGDQGMVFGYATNETEEFLPMPISLAHKLSRQLTNARKENIIPYLRPDGKTQVTVEYEDNRPVRIDTVVVSTQHDDGIALETLREDILEKVVKAVLPKELLNENTKYYINPTGRFVIGGPVGDSGLTGRKIIVDTYGGYARHGGGAFSGKDPTKVDRSASYMARYIAKNVVANHLADRCEIQISYAIGVAKPISVYVDTFGTNKIAEEKIQEVVLKNFDMTPDGIIRALDLRRPIYRQTTNYGHFGKDSLSWEKIITL